MIRDTFFDMHRFACLCRKEIKESLKVNLLRIGVIYGVLAIAFVWNGYLEYNSWALTVDAVQGDPTHHFVSLMFSWGILIMGCLSASFCMERMKTKTSRTAMLLLPATMFEKFLLRWLFCVIGFLVVYFVAFQLADWTRVLIYMIKYPEMDFIAPVSLMEQMVGPADHWVVFYNSSFFLLAVSFYFFVQSCFVLGSSIWPKNAFLKTFVSGAIVVVCYLLLGALMTKLFFFGRNTMGNAFWPEETMFTLGTTLFFLGAIYNSVIAYFRFKESEIINRW